MKSLKYSISLILLLFIAKPVFAFCPACTMGAGLGLLLVKYFNFNILIIGFLIAVFLSSGFLLILDSLILKTKKKYFKTLLIVSLGLYIIIFLIVLNCLNLIQTEDLKSMYFGFIYGQIIIFLIYIYNWFFKIKLKSHKLTNAQKVTSLVFLLFACYLTYQLLIIIFNLLY